MTVEDMKKAGWITPDELLAQALAGELKEHTVFMLQFANGELYLNGVLRFITEEGWCIMLGGSVINLDNLLVARPITDIKF